MCDDVVHVARRYTVERVACRCVGDKHQIVAPVKSINRRRKAGGLTGKSGDHKVSTAVRNDLSEILARITRWLASIKDHIRIVGLKPVDPTGETCCCIEERQFSNPPHEGNREPHRSRVSQYFAAVCERLGYFGKSEGARRGNILLLQVDKYHHWSRNGIRECPQINDRAHADGLCAPGRVTGRVADLSSIPRVCHRPSCRMITYGSVSIEIAFGCRGSSRTIST